ncbi:hypothetical protein [Curtobacterium sp. MCBD17_028]|nr:hypothetical protein [Curtobacterium sp. MCBD17_028]
MEKSTAMQVPARQGQEVPAVLVEADGVVDLELDGDFLPDAEPADVIRSS